MRYPSVTQVLGTYADFSFVGKDVLKSAAYRGSEVHRICSAIAQGIPYMAAIPPEQAGYVLSFQQWFGIAVDEVVSVEEEFTDTINGYTGRPDLIIRMKGDRSLSICDLKTPLTKSPLWCAQLAAYMYLARVNGHEIGRLFSLRLDRDGGLPKLDEYKDDLRYFAAFLAALTAHRFFCANSRRDREHG